MIEKAWRRRIDRALALLSRAASLLSRAPRRAFADHLRDQIDRPYTTLTARSLEHSLALAGETAGHQLLERELDTRTNPQHDNRPAAHAPEQK